MGYPNDFSWGVASASYQVEGAAKEDGKGASIWGMFTRNPGAMDGTDRAIASV
jgi:beta-glucosidase